MQKSGKLKKFLKFLLVVIIIAAVGAGGFYGYQVYNMNRRRTAMVNAMANATAMQRAAVQDISEIVSASGTVGLNNEESVYAAAAERVAQVLVEVGDKVKKGQIILTYDINTKREQLEKQIQQTQINLDNQNLTLQSMTVPAGESTIRQLQSSVDSAGKSVYDAQNSVTSTSNKINDQQDAIAQAEDTYNNSQDAIDKADRDIQYAQDALAKAQQKVADAQTELEKQKQLLDVGGISESDYEKFIDTVSAAQDGVTQAQTTLNNAFDAKKSAQNSQKQAGYTITNAQNTLRDLQNTLESNMMNVTAAQQGLETARANLDDAYVVLADDASKINYEKQQNQIKLTELDLADYKKQLEDLTENAISPMDGSITTVNVSQGKSVDTSTVLVTIADFSDLIVNANISEYDIPKLKIGQAVVMTSDGMENVRFQGRVSKIGDSAVSQSAASGMETVVPVEISFIGPVTDIKPGFNLDLEITVAANPKAVTVPITALQSDAETGGYSVFTVDMRSRTIKKIPVTKGITSDMIVEITSGVNEGDEVITSPTPQMRDGMTLAELEGGLVGMGTENNGFGIFGGNRMNMGGGMQIRTNDGGGTGNVIRQQPAPMQGGGR